MSNIFWTKKKKISVNKKERKPNFYFWVPNNEKSKSNFLTTQVIWIKKQKNKKEKQNKIIIKYISKI